MYPVLRLELKIVCWITMKLFTLYVGSVPRKQSLTAVTLRLLQELLAPTFASFTVVEGEGVFRGQAERAFVVKVTTFDAPTFLREVEKLRDNLDQEGIGIEHEGRYHRVIEGGDVRKLMQDMYPRIRAEYFDTVFQTQIPGSNWPARFAVITAWNPEGEKQNNSTNEACHSLLLSHCASLGISHWNVTGCSPELQHREPGIGIESTLSDAISIGRKFGQEAIYWVEDGHLLLVSCQFNVEVPLGDWESRLCKPIR